jgi:hypothetical protein
LVRFRRKFLLRRVLAGEACEFGYSLATSSVKVLEVGRLGPALLPLVDSVEHSKIFKNREIQDCSKIAQGYFYFSSKNKKQPVELILIRVLG